MLIYSMTIKDVHKCCFTSQIQYNAPRVCTYVSRDIFKHYIMSVPLLPKATICSTPPYSFFCIKCSPTLGKMPSLTISHASQQINELPKRERKCSFSGSNGKLKMANHSELGKLMKNVAEAFLNL